MPTPNGLIMHSELRLGNSVIMISDAMQNPPTQSSCHLYVDNADAVWKQATEAGCEIIMPLQDMFWGDRYGLLKDKWGNRWSIAQHIEDVPPDEMTKRVAEAMKNFPAPQ